MHFTLVAAIFIALAYIAPVARRLIEPGLGKEVMSHFQIAIPSMLRYLFFTVSDSLCVALIGHFDATPVEHFDGATLGTSLISITGLSIGLGFLGAMAPFVAQECGSQREDRCGIHLWNYYKAAAAICACSWCVSNWADLIMISLGQDAKVSACVQKFARIAVWALPFQLIAKAIQQVLDAQADVIPGLVTDGSAAFLQVPCTYLALQASYGYEGAAMSKVLVNAFVTTGLAIFINWSGRSESVWQVNSGEPLAAMKPFLQLAASSTFATCIEWWAQEVMIILSGWLDDPGREVAAQSILFELATVFYMVWVGSKNAMAMRVGNLLGGSNAEKVPQCLCVGVVACVFEVIVVMLVGFLARDCLIRVFTTNEDVAEQVVEVWPAMLAVFVPYGIAFVLFGVLAGAGRQSIVATIFFISCVVSLCLGAHLCFASGMGIEGLWMGNFTFFAIASLILYSVVMRTDWDAIDSLACVYQALDRQISPSFDPHLQQDFIRVITPI